MEDILHLNNKIYIVTSSSLADQRTRVLKFGEVFAIFDVFGDIKPVGTGAQGLYMGATRFVSQMEFRIGGRYPFFLSSTITHDDMLMTADLANPDIIEPDGKKLHHASFHIFRSKFLSETSCHEELQITNFTNEALRVPLSFFFKSDFADMFEIRGVPRKQRGEILPVQRYPGQAILSYRGLDHKVRSSRIVFDPAPAEMTDFECRFLLPMEARGQIKLYVNIDCIEGEAVPDEKVKTYHDMCSCIEESYQKEAAKSCKVLASSERFNTWISRSKADILLMTTYGDSGPYPYAGIPWFNTIFGRDGILTALQYLWIDPLLARGVLTYLAKYQASEDSVLEDSQPGKILHEFRKGEMVDLHEVPFKRYYGSVDATPLFVVLAGYYSEFTADLPFIEALWPSIKAALNWIDKYGDADGDGFVEYFRRSPRGLLNQGWKDSHDAISHLDGNLAEGPIALAEVQGYVYEAKIQAAQMARRLGEIDLAARLTAEAKALKKKFVERFWDPESECFILALDGEKKPCRVISSNAGQCLFSGIAEQGQAHKVSKKLLSEEMFSGWGIRTLSSQAVRYNPMSYHNGSVWPHDNSLIAEGFARYDLKSEVLRVVEGLFDVSINVDLYRLPELFCGFPRRRDQGPTLYPVACSPQAWAAGSVFMLLKACLGLSIDGFENKILFRHPVLPPFIDELRLKGLRTPKSEVDILFRRHGHEVSVYIEKRTGKLEINIVK